MYKRIAVLLFLLLFTIMGCSKNEMVGNQPPKAMIQIGKETYETKLGTYCWSQKGKGKCVDTVGPAELLKGKNPIIVEPGEVVLIKMNYNPKPNEFHVIQISNNKQIEVPFKKWRFIAPTQKGIFYYSLGVWWNDKKNEHISNGDASYVFALEVR